MHKTDKIEREDGTACKVDTHRENMSHPTRKIIIVNIFEIIFSRLRKGYTKLTLTHG